MKLKFKSMNGLGFVCKCQVEINNIQYSMFSFMISCNKGFVQRVEICI